MHLLNLVWKSFLGLLWYVYEKGTFDFGSNASPNYLDPICPLAGNTSHSSVESIPGGGHIGSTGNSIKIDFPKGVDFHPSIDIVFVIVALVEPPVVLSQGCGVFTNVYCCRIAPC